MTHSSGSFVGTVRITASSRFVKSVRSVGLSWVPSCMLCFRLPAAHPASAGPENVQCRSVFIQFVRALVSPAQFLFGASVQPVFDSRRGRITCKIFPSACLLRCRNGARLPPISPEGSKPSSFAGWQPRSQIQKLILFSPVLQTFAWNYIRSLGSSDTRLPWPACTPGLWSQSHCWSWLLCGQTICGTADRNAEQNWPPPQMPTPDIYCHTWNCSLLSSSDWTFARLPPPGSSWQNCQ